MSQTAQCATLESSCLEGSVMRLLTPVHKVSLSLKCLSLPDQAMKREILLYRPLSSASCSMSGVVCASKRRSQAKTERLTHSYFTLRQEKKSELHPWWKRTCNEATRSGTKNFVRPVMATVPEVFISDGSQDGWCV